MKHIEQADGAYTRGYVACVRSAEGLLRQLRERELALRLEMEERMGGPSASTSVYVDNDRTIINLQSQIDHVVSAATMYGPGIIAEMILRERE